MKFRIDRGDEKLIANERQRRYRAISRNRRSTGKKENARRSCRICRPEGYARVVQFRIELETLRKQMARARRKWRTIPGRPVPLARRTRSRSISWDELKLLLVMGSRVDNDSLFAIGFTRCKRNWTNKNRNTVAARRCNHLKAQLKRNSNKLLDIVAATSHLQRHRT